MLFSSIYKDADTCSTTYCVVRKEGSAGSEVASNVSIYNHRMAHVRTDQRLNANHGGSRKLEDGMQKKLRMKSCELLDD